jgi:hypothetical protein
MPRLAPVMTVFPMSIQVMPAAAREGRRSFAAGTRTFARLRPENR